MTTPSNEQETTTTQTDLSGLEFADYERVRRGETLESKSAPVEETEQKESPESGTEEPEAKEESKEELEEDSKDSKEDDSEDEAKDEKPKKKGGFQRRIDKLNAAKAEAQREAEYWRKLALDKGAEAPKEKPETPAAKDGKPSADDFETHAEYVEALTDWKVEQKAKALEEKQRKAALETEQQKLQSAHLTRVKSFAEKTADFEEVIADVEDIPVSAAVQEIIVTSENGPELMYELAKNRAEFERISKLPPLAAAREIGRIETRIAAKASEKPEPKKLTKAPPPPKPVGGSKASTAKSIYDPDISFEEYERRRREAMRRKA